MTLVISLLEADDSGETLAPGMELAGFESWRGELYGSSTARRLGLRLLPQLETGDLRCTNRSDLEQIQAECESLLRHLVEFEQPEELVRSRVGNVLRATELALEIDCGIEIS